MHHHRHNKFLVCVKSYLAIKLILILILLKLMSHIMKLWESVVEARPRTEVSICEQQYGCMPKKSTTHAIFALRMLIEKYREGQRELH